MSTAARDYALPIDGQVHHISCGPGPVLTAEIETDDASTYAYLWVQQTDPPNPSRTDRRFTTRTGRDPWPATAHHIATLRDTTPSGRSVHVLEVL